MTLIPHHDQRAWLRACRSACIPLLASIVGALALYTVLQPKIVPPFSEEAIEMMEPWRLAALNAVYYTPLSLAQWFVMRRYVPNAYWWIVSTLIGVVMVQPILVGLLWASDFDRLAFLGWLFGLASGAYTTLSQWLVLRQWTPQHALWFGAIPLAWLGAFPLAWLLVLPFRYLPSLDLSSAPDVAMTLLAWGLYQGIMSGVLLYLMIAGRTTRNAGHQSSA